MSGHVTNKMLNEMMLICFVHPSLIAGYKMTRNVVPGFYSVSFCTVVVPSHNVFWFAAFAGVFDDSFDYVLFASPVLFFFTLSLRC